MATIARNGKDDELHRLAGATPSEHTEKDADGFPNVLADGWGPYLRRSIGTLLFEEKLNILMLVCVPPLRGPAPARCPRTRGDLPRARRGRASALGRAISRGPHLRPPLRTGCCSRRPRRLR
jgi:hypothetical protein